MFHTTRFDIILSTFPDQWELTLGALLAEKYRVPLVADFRDIAEQEEGMQRPARQAFQSLRFKLRRKLTVRHARLVTAVSKYHKNILMEKTKKETILVYNGYDETIFCPGREPDSEGKGRFRITYTGRLLNLWYRDPTILFQAVDELISEKKILPEDILLDFYGCDVEKLTPVLARLKNDGFYNFTPKVSYSLIPSILTGSQLLLVLVNQGGKGILTTKLFEYIGMKKPLLCITGDGGELDELVREFGLGFSIGSKEELKTKIIECLNLWKDGKFPGVVESEVTVFSRRYQAGVLSGEMHKLLQSVASIN